jgi:hypothetical protein
LLPNLSVLWCVRVYVQGSTVWSIWPVAMQRICPGRAPVRVWSWTMVRATGLRWGTIASIRSGGAGLFFLGGLMPLTA